MNLIEMAITFFLGKLGRFLFKVWTTLSGSHFKLTSIANLS